jgi:hypothetical protein
VAILCKLINDAKNIHFINLESNRIDIKGAHLLATVLRTQPHVSGLLLAHNPITENGENQKGKIVIITLLFYVLSRKPSK